VLAVLVQGGRADRSELAAGEHRLEEVAGVHRPLGGAGTHDRVQLVDERDDLALAVGDLLQDGLEPLLELASVLGAGEHRAQVERDQSLPLERLGDVTSHDPLREPLDDRGLPDAGLPDQYGVVLGASREHLDRSADLFVAADHGIELALGRLLGEIAPVPLEALVLVLGVLRRHPVSTADLREGGQGRSAIETGIR
jgi:hypothetical protein